LVGRGQRERWPEQLESPVPEACTVFRAFEVMCQALREEALTIEI
jgi:hypothetical protein